MEILMQVKLAELRAKRADVLDKMKPLAEKEAVTADEQKAFDGLKKEADELLASIERTKAYQASQAATAQEAPGQEKDKVAASVETDPYVKDKTLMLGGAAKMLGAGGGNIYNARSAAKDLYGESHPVTKALITGSGVAGGFIVPPDVMTEVIPLLRAQAVVRAAGPRTIPMPRGTMTLPGQGSAATASYGSEGAKIAASQPGLRSVVATFKKLTALVPMSNDMMRYANPAVDAFVRDDMVRIIALKEDNAFLIGDGLQDSPRGYLSFANGWVSYNGGTLGAWSTTAASTLAVNATDPANSTGGNFITSNATYTLTTVTNELAGAVNRLDTANVPENKRRWFFNPRIFNYLNNVQNSLGSYVFRDELTKGTLLGYPFSKTTQILTTYWDATSTNKDLSFIFLVEMTESMLFDSMQLELAVSNEASYVDSTGSTRSAFQNDETLIRAIAEHDHQMRHDAAVAVIQAVRWAPAVS